MANGMDDRRKGLEEEYFHRKNQEAIEKLRAKMKVSEEAKAAGKQDRHRALSACNSARFGFSLQ